MKKIFRIFLFLILVNMTFAGTIFKMLDITGDDNGPGTYTYPKNSVFLPGSFDLINFEISDDVDNYIFSFKIPIYFKNDPAWKNVNGWDVQMFDVYLNFGEGYYKQTIAGRNVQIKQGWDRAIIVSPEDNKIMWKREIEDKNIAVFDDNSDEEDLTEDIILPDSYYIDRNEIEVKIAKRKLPLMDKLKGVQVLVSGSEGFPSRENTYIRVVNEQNSEWRFGGGSDYTGDPNILDILGDNKKLANYKSTDGESIFCEIEMIEVKK